MIGAYWVLGIDLPIGGCLAVIALSAWLNVALRLRYPASQRLKSSYAFIMLAYDILQLAALLYLTGGLENPFAFLLIAPVTVSASTLPLRITAALGALTIAAATVLTSFHHSAALVPSNQPAAALPLCDGRVGGGGVGHSVHRLLFVAHGGRSAAHGQGLGRGRDGAGAGAEIIGARRSRRRGGARARHAAGDHRRGD